MDSTSSSGEVYSKSHGSYFVSGVAIFVLKNVSLVQLTQGNRHPVKVNLSQEICSYKQHEQKFEFGRRNTYLLTYLWS
jgi:hypothetical protein